VGVGAGGLEDGVEGLRGGADDTVGQGELDLGVLVCAVKMLVEIGLAFGGKKNFTKNCLV